MLQSTIRYFSRLKPKLKKNKFYFSKPQIRLNNKNSLLNRTLKVLTPKEILTLFLKPLVVIVPIFSAFVYVSGGTKSIKLTLKEISVNSEES